MHALEVKNLTLRYGKVDVLRGITFHVWPGEHVTLLGPSGCGKTTTLRAIAGLETPTGGEILLQGKAVFHGEQGLNVPTERRGLSMVFQSYAIWPHMTVFENVAYGLRVRRTPAPALKEKVMEALRMVKLEHLANRPAPALSGGQQQRVALARAAAVGTPMLLFDEPLSNLDAKLRQEMRIEIKEMQQRLGLAAVYVTHDQEEALAISDRIILMNQGLIEQEGTPREMYHTPATRFAADFMGSANLIPGRFRTGDGGPYAPFETESGALLIGRPARGTGESGWAAIKAAHLQILPEQVPGTPNTWVGVVQQRLFLGDAMQYVVHWGDQTGIIRQADTQTYEVGQEVYLHVPPQHCVLLDR